MRLADEILGITEAKTELPQRLKRLQNGELDRVVIVRQNHPVAVMVSIEEYERMRQLEEQRELLEDLHLLAEALKANEAGPHLTLDQLKAKFGIP